MSTRTPVSLSLPAPHEQKSSLNTSTNTSEHAYTTASGACLLARAMTVPALARGFFLAENLGRGLMRCKGGLRLSFVSTGENICQCLETFGRDER